MTNQQGALQYADRDHTDLGSYYMRHVSAMTGEALHSKSAIAAELAHRDREIDRLQAENANLNAGYAAARLEIESLQARIKTMAEEHADELMVAHLDGRMRAAQPAGAQQPGAAYAAQDSEHQRAIMEAERNASLDAYSRVVYLSGAESRLYEAGFTNGWQRASHGQAPAQAAPATVAGPSEMPTVPDSVLAYVHAYGDSRADEDGLSGMRVSELILALRRWAKSIASAPTTQPAPSAVVEPSDHDIDDLVTSIGPTAGIRRDSRDLAMDQLRALVRHALATWGHAQQEAAYTSVQLAEMVLSDCGHSSNYTPLLDRVAARIDAHVERRLDEFRCCLEYKPAHQPLPASQGDALDAEQHEMDARHAAIYRWMLSHVADVFCIFDNWLDDKEANTDELHDALAARAAQEGK